jgi:hypothetical protein
MIPVSKSRRFKRIKIAPEKMIAGIMYLISVKKTIVFLTNKNRVTAAITNSKNKYQ